MTIASLACVHAHPDDESLFGAGTVNYYADRGAEVTLVTCTRGQLGIDGAGHSGDARDHDARETAAVRAGELVRAADLLGYRRTVTLGYHDSGMLGWASNDDPRAFVNVDVEASARVLAALFDEVRARVVITYDESGFYGHPDHVQAHRVTRRAVELSAHVERLYCPVIPRDVLNEFVTGAGDLGLSLPAWVRDAGTHVDAASVATTMDVRDRSVLKHRAMATHASQVDNADLVGMDEDLFRLLFGTEYFQRVWSRRDVARNADATDLFGGLS